MISLIIPVYNPKQNLLKRCLQSILNQEYSDYEIILVNDGSTIPDRNWFEDLKQYDSRLKVYYQENKGVSAARNLGIVHSKGDYIAFVDGDDEIDSRFLVESVKLAEETGADLVIGALQRVENDISQPINESDTVYTFDYDNMYELRRSHLNIEPRKMPYIVLGSPCARLIKRKVLTNLRFNEHISIFEDQLFNRELMLYVRHAIYIYHIWYYYYQYADSSIHKEVISNGGKGTSLRLDYLAEWNRINLLETDQHTKSVLLYISMRRFIAAVNYWIINKPEHINKSSCVVLINDLFDQLKMNDIINEFEKTGGKTAKGCLMYLLLKRKMFSFLIIFLQIYNRVRRIRNR